MNKKELVWLITRLTGTYFAYLTIVSLFTVIGAVPALIFMPPELESAPNANTTVANTRVQALPFNANPMGESSPPTKTETAQTDKESSETVKLFLWYIFLTAIYGAVGWYLLRDGRLFYLLLMREDSIRKKETEPEVTTLNL